MRRQRRWPMVVLGLWSVLLIGADVVVITQRDKATAVTVDAALERFRSDATSTTEPAEPAAPGAATATTAVTATTALADVGLTPPPTIPGVPTPPPAPVAVTTVARPSAGVYRLQTIGSEQLPSLNAERDYPDETTATVTMGEGCAWSLRDDLLAEHTDTYDLCSRPEGLVATGFSITIRWFSIRQHVAFTCAQPVPMLVHGAAVGSTTGGTCRNDDGETEFAVVRQPDEAIAIGATTVVAARVDAHLTMRGKFAGTADYQVWLEPTSGMFLRVARTVDANGDTALGHQRYTEAHQSTLLDLQPAT